jgi:hypothetical protein
MNKKGLSELIIGLLVVGLILLLIVNFLYGGKTFRGIGDAIASIFELEETDPTIWDRNFHAERKVALEIFYNVSNAFTRVSQAKNPDGTPQQTCFGVFQTLPDEFVDKAYQIQAKKTPDGKGTIFTLMQFRLDETNPDKTKQISTWQPVSAPTTLQGFVPCAVYGDNEPWNVYKDMIQKGQIQTGYKYGEEIYQFSLRDENKKIFLGLDGSKAEEKFGFYPGDDVLYYVILKQDNKVCVLPTYGDFWDDCSDPKDGTLDSDCLDNEDDYLPDRIMSGSLNKYVCSGFEKIVEHMVKK